MFSTVTVTSRNPESHEQLVVDIDAASSELYFTLSDIANNRSPRTILHALIQAGEPRSAEEIAVTLGEAPWELDQRIGTLVTAGVLLVDESQDPALYSVL